MKNQFTRFTHAELRGTALNYAASLREQADIHDHIAANRATGPQRRRVLPAPGRDRSMADLLDVLAQQVHHGGGTGGDPEKMLQHPGATLTSVFGPKLTEQLRNARHMLVLEAANITLRNRAHDWLSTADGGPTGIRVRWPAMLDSPKFCLSWRRSGALRKRMRRAPSPGPVGGQRLKRSG